MFLLNIALALLVLAQDADTSKLIDQLGDSDPAVRDVAEATLRKLGEAALGSLRKASGDPDRERAARARSLAEEIDIRLRGRIACWRMGTEGPEGVLLDPGTGQGRTIFRVPGGIPYQRALQLYLYWVPGREALLVLSEHPTRNDWTGLLGWVVNNREGKTVALCEHGEITEVSGPEACSPMTPEVVFTTAGRHLDVIDLDRQTRRRLKTPEGTPRYASWSPDGKKLVFEMQGNGMYVMTLDGERTERVCRPYLAFASFTMAGDGLIGILQDEKRQTFDLVRLELTGGKITYLRNDVEWERPGVSPNGKRLVYTRKKADDLREVVVIGLDGKDEVILGSGTSPSWSRDGSTLAFERKGHVILADLKKRTEKELSAGKFPTWSR